MYVYVQSQACMLTCRHDNVYVCMFTCTHTGLRVRVCAHIYAGRVHMWICKQLHICRPSLHVCDCIFICMYICMHTGLVCMCSCICLHICTPSLQVVYMFTYMQTEFTCVCVYINIYIHGNYMFEGLYLHDDDCFYYHSWRNNVVIAFGTLSSFLT